MHAEASREVATALYRYQQQATATTARRFDGEVDRMLTAIESQPDRFGFYDDRTHEAALNRFPFTVYYRIDDNGDVLVVAVAHQSREPGYWVDRN